jgi:aminoglycoside 3-N-acetyltransferase I
LACQNQQAMSQATATQIVNVNSEHKPLSITILQLTAAHTDFFAALVQLFQDVFETGKVLLTQQQHLRQLVNDPRFIVLTAIQSNKVIGGLTAHVLNSYTTEKPSVYLYDIAVLPEWQRQGIGRQLVASLLQACKKEGYAEVFVQAEADDKNAIHFYRSTPISGKLNATHFYYHLEDN